MAFYSGIDGVLFFGSGNSASAGGCSAKVKNFQWSINQTVLDTTSLCDTDKTIIPGVRSTTGSCSLHFYQSGTGAASTLINKIVKSGTSYPDGDTTRSEQVTFKLQVDGKSITIPAFITSASMTCSVGEVVSVDISFEADGAVTAISL